MNVEATHDQTPVELGRLGVEIELLAPKGRSRRDLAEAIAAHYGGSVRRFFHPQGEQSKAANTPFFENLTLGFIVEDGEGDVIAQCVDDFTLQDDLDQKHLPQAGWYRLVSDDARFLRLAMLHLDPSDPLECVLDPLAEIFGVTSGKSSGGMVRVADETDAPIVLGASLPGERERPCELITAPIESGHSEHLETLLGIAQSLDFLIPAEGATHLHFDAAPLCDASTIANLVRFLNVHGEALKEHVGTNERCRRLGAWPSELLEVVNSPEFVDLEWEVAREVLSQVKLTKFCDFNIRNMIHLVSNKHTFEVRILPVSLDVDEIMGAANLFTSILDWAKSGNGQLKPIPNNFWELI